MKSVNAVIATVGLVALLGLGAVGYLSQRDTTTPEPRPAANVTAIADVEEGIKAQLLKRINEAVGEPLKNLRIQSVTCEDASYRNPYELTCHAAYRVTTPNPNWTAGPDENGEYSPVELDLGGVDEYATVTRKEDGTWFTEVSR